MIRCYRCPLQDLCPTVNLQVPLAGNEHKLPLRVEFIADDKRNACPLYVAANEASKQIPGLTRRKE